MLPMKHPQPQQQQQQRNRLSVTFELDRPEEMSTLANGRPMPFPDKYSLTNRRSSSHLCYDVLNPSKFIIFFHC